MDEVSRQAVNFSAALATAVKERRLELGISQFELAQRAGISSQYVGYIERSTRRPTTEVLARLALGLETRPSDLARAAEELAAK